MVEIKLSDNSFVSCDIRPANLYAKLAECSEFVELKDCKIIPGNFENIERMFINKIHIVKISQV